VNRTVVDQEYSRSIVSKVFSAESLISTGMDRTNVQIAIIAQAQQGWVRHCASGN